MTQAELDRELADVTGESVSEIRRRGFSLIVLPNRGPLVMDWDAVQEADRPRYIPRRTRPRRRVAA